MCALLIVGRESGGYGIYGTAIHNSLLQNRKGRHLFITLAKATVDSVSAGLLVRGNERTLRSQPDDTRALPSFRTGPSLIIVLCMASGVQSIVFPPTEMNHSLGLWAGWIADECDFFLSFITVVCCSTTASQLVYPGGSRAWKVAVFPLREDISNNREDPCEK